MEYVNTYSFNKGLSELNAQLTYNSRHKLDLSRFFFKSFDELIHQELKSF